MRLDGQTTSSKQKEIIRNFNTKPDHIIFLITSKAGGKGLNLTAASRVVLLDVAWNPTFDCKFNMKINFYHFDNRFIDLSIYSAQSIFRVYRYGQTKECFIYRLVAKNTMEAGIYRRAVKKKR